MKYLLSHATGPPRIGMDASEPVRVSASATRADVTTSPAVIDTIQSDVADH